LSEIRVTTVSDTAGTGPVTLTKQTTAKGYCLFNQSTPQINASFNTSSLTDTSTGKGSINWTSGMSGGETAYSCVTSNVNVALSNPYAVSLTSDRAYVTITASSWSFRSVFANTGADDYFDPNGAMATAHGDLA